MTTGFKMWIAVIISLATLGIAFLCLKSNLKMQSTSNNHAIEAIQKVIQ